jgi:hypothetical protein
MTACCVNSVVKLYDENANKKVCISAIEKLIKKCQPGDYFIFYFAGHGANLVDIDGDEGPGGFDDALCLPTAEGKLSCKDANGHNPDWLSDDELAVVLNTSMRKGVNVLLLCDCCHSGTIADFKSASWSDYRGVSISACRDDQLAQESDVFGGGLMTCSMLKAIQDLRDKGIEDYSCSQLFNMICEVHERDGGFQTKGKLPEDIQLGFSPALGGPENMAWPLIPQDRFHALEEKVNKACPVPIYRNAGNHDA